MRKPAKPYLKWLIFFMLGTTLGFFITEYRMKDTIPPVNELILKFLLVQTLALAIISLFLLFLRIKACKAKLLAKQIAAQKWHLVEAYLIQNEELQYLDSKGWRKISNNHFGLKDGSALLKLSSKDLQRIPLKIGLHQIIHLQKQQVVLCVFKPWNLISLMKP